MKKAILNLNAWPMDPTSYVTEEANVDVANVNAMKVMLANFANAPRMNAQKVKLVHRFVYLLYKYIDYLLSIFIFDIFDFQSMIEFVTITETVLAKKMDKS